MHIILNNAVFDSQKIKRYITKLTANELNNLTEPCYYPVWKKHFHELLSYTGLKEKDIKDFGKRFFHGTKAEVTLSKYGKNVLIQNDVGINFILILMYYFLNKGDQKTFLTIMIYHLIHQYSNRIRVYMKFCKPEVFSYTLDHLNPTHLFIREKTIPNAIYHLALEMKKRYTSYLTELNPDKISDFFYESRSRISQSLRSFAEAYHSNAKQGFGISSQKETETGEEYYPQELERGNRIAELVSNKICVYKEIDYKAFEEARSLTRINMSTTIIIIKQLQNTNLSNDIKFNVELFLKDVKKTNEICGKDFVPYVKKLMSLKRTIKTVYFKHEVNNLLLNIIKNTNIEKKYYKLTSQTQFQINSFLAFYILFYTRNLIC